VERHGLDDTFGADGCIVIQPHRRETRAAEHGTQNRSPIRSGLLKSKYHVAGWLKKE
jgi:hypothetical protein